MSGTEVSVEVTRGKIQNWLMGEGWNLAEQVHPDLAWLIRAEDAGGRRILVGQNKARPDHIHLEARVNIAEEHRKQFESLPLERRREALWKLRFRLLQMNVDFSGVSEPMEAVLLTQRIYLDGVTKDAFIQRFLTLRNAVIAVIWSVMQDLEGVEPPAESAKPKSLLPNHELSHESRCNSALCRGGLDARLWRRTKSDGLSKSQKFRICHFDPFGKRRVNSGRNLTCQGKSS